MFPNGKGVMGVLCGYGECDVSSSSCGEFVRTGPVKACC